MTMPSIAPTIIGEAAQAGLDAALLTLVQAAGVATIHHLQGLTSGPQTTLNNVITAPLARRSGFQACAQVSSMLPLLASATSSQIDTWFTNNVTTQAQAVAVLKAVVKLIAYTLVPPQ